MDTMTLLAFLDIRPYLFIAGLPVFVGLALVVSRAARSRFKNQNVILLSGALFAALFTVFLTSVGPFVDQRETREYVMAWKIEPGIEDGRKEIEIVLTFVDFPDHFIGEYSDELANHLRTRGEAEVKVVFDVTSDYGTVRGFNPIEIAGLRGWKSECGYAGARGEAIRSPWD